MCGNISDDEYNTLSVDPTIVWYCLSCSVALCELPFADCSLSESTLSTGLSYSTLDELLHGSLIRSLSCLCFNARSIINKRLDLFAVFSESSPDVVVITEDNSIKLFQLIILFSGMTEIVMVGGVLIAISDRLSAV